MTDRYSSVSYVPLVESRTTSRLPKGSSTTARRPIGMSKGPATTLPPPVRKTSATASAEATFQPGSYCCPVVRTISVVDPGVLRPACPIASLRQRSS